MSKKTDLPKAKKDIMKGVKHKIVILSGKGGVGKTTVATNLAMSFAKKKLQVGILDVDVYGPNVPKLLGLEGQHPSADDNKINPVEGPMGLKVMSMGFLLRNADDAVAWRGPLVARAVNQFLEDVTWGDLDILVVDLPPGTGDEILSVLQSIPDISGVIIVSTPQEVAVLDARRAIQLVTKMGVPIIGIIENMNEFVCPSCGEVHQLFGEGAAAEAAKKYEVEHLGTLPFDPRIIKLSDEGTPFVISDPDSKASKDFEAIVQKLIDKIKVKID